MDMILCCIQDKMMKLDLISDPIPPTNFFNNVGDGLLVEILCRLPSRVAIRLKSVCRRWRSLISSDYFITFFHHRRHDPSLPPLDDHDSLSYSMLIQFAYSDSDLCSSLVRCRYTTTHTAAGAKLYGHHRLDLSFLPCPQTKVKFKASCDDLVLCSFKNTFFYVCNLLTRQWVALPPAPRFIDQAIGLLCVPVPKPCSICHLQCDSNKKFMVVRIHRYNEGVPQSKFKVQFFSSEEGEWTTRLVSSPQPLTTFTPYTCYGSTRRKSYSYLVAHKGLLHWQICSSVVVFDPFNTPQTFSHVIDLPLESHDHCPSTIAVCRDRVCVQIWFWSKLRGVKCSWDIWELEEYVMGGKWNLVHKHIDERPGFYCVEYVHPDGNILYLRKNRSVWLCNYECECGEVDEEYKLIHRTDGRHNLFLNGNILQIVDQWWPTPPPALPTTSISTSHD